MIVAIIKIRHQQFFIFIFYSSDLVVFFLDQLNLIHGQQFNVMIKKKTSYLS